MAKRKPVSRKKKNNRESEHEHAEHEEHEESEQEDDGAAGADNSSGGDPEDTANHPDADQDKALIAKMLDEYLGGQSGDMDDEEKEALHELAAEALQGHREMGKSEKEAYQHAGEALKLAAHMTQKRKEAIESEHGEHEEDDAPPPPKKKAAPAPAAKSGAKPAPAADGSDDGDDGDGDDGQPTESNMESLRESNRSLRKKLMTAEGRIAILEAKLSKVEVQGYMDKALKESGLPSSVTKHFRKSVGTPKSKADFDSKWKAFQEGVKTSRPELDFSVLMEKSAVNEDGTPVGGKQGLNFSDCAD